MNENRSNDYNYLDKVRQSDGIGKCKAVFGEIAHKDKRRAIVLLNDPRLTFACLFILLPQIESFFFHRSLNSRNIIAMGIVRQILNPNDTDNRADYLSAKSNAVYPVLKWMLETGHAEDGMSEEYEEVLEITVSVLINLYRDKSVLPLVVNMIFERSRKDHNIHDLAWALFQVHDPNVLKLIAEHMRASDQKEAELAYSLLHMKEGPSRTPGKEKQYQSYIEWLEENDPFLYFTEESFQFASNPAFCSVDLERKYMHKGTPSYDPQPVMPLNDDENRYLAAFKPLSNEEKTVLSDYSYKMRSKDAEKWEKWMKFPIDEQIRTAKIEKEGPQ